MMKRQRSFKEYEIGFCLHRVMLWDSTSAVAMVTGWAKGRARAWVNGCTIENTDACDGISDYEGKMRWCVLYACSLPHERIGEYQSQVLSMIEEELEKQEKKND